MAVTGREIAETTMEAIRCQGGYIWGQMGAEWTAAKQANLEKNYKADPEGMKDYKLSAEYGKKWIGHRVWDCAGLCRWAAKQHGIAIHAGSNLIWRNDLSKKGELGKTEELPVGALVFTGDSYDKHPHIGTYTGDGMVTEANGTIKGCIQSGLHSGKWKWWGLEKGVTYDFIPGGETQEPEKPKETAGSAAGLPTIRKGNKNVYVKQLQTMLDKLGYSLGICGIDGDYGTATERAVKEFQRDHGLAQDGVTGPKTWAALQAAVDKLNAAPAEEKYTVTITGLTKKEADELCKTWKTAVSRKE